MPEAHVSSRSNFYNVLCKEAIFYLFFFFCSACKSDLDQVLAPVRLRDTIIEASEFI
jgi:hypothetical protein